MGRLAEPYWLRWRWLFAAAVDAATRKSRAERLEAAVQELAAAEGIPPRVKATEEAIRTAKFSEWFHLILGEMPSDRKPKNEEDIRNVALGALAAMGVDTADVHFTVFWAGPDGNEAEGLKPNDLRFSACSMSPFARARITETVQNRGEV